jgi:hypothetical protein
MFFAIVSGCSKLIPFVLFCSSDCDELFSHLKSDYGIVLGDTKKYIDEDNDDKSDSDKSDNDIPYEFQNISSDDAEHVVSYYLESKQIIKIAKHTGYSDCGKKCGGYLGLFKTTNKVIDFSRIIKEIIAI